MVEQGDSGLGISTPIATSLLRDRAAKVLL